MGEDPAIPEGGTTNGQSVVGVSLGQLPLCTDGTERLRYNTLKRYPVSTSGGMSPAPNPRVAVPPR